MGERFATGQKGCLFSTMRYRGGDYEDETVQERPSKKGISS